MKPKVCILAAGIGARLGEKTRFFNKAILRIGNKAAISHSIDAFDDDLEYVIALGYQADIVRQYIEIAHPNKKITFVETDKYTGPGAGAGYALLQCEKELRSPFYFICCDSLISWNLDLKWDIVMQKTHDRDWVITSTIPEKDRSKYCTIIKNKENKVIEFFDKTKNGTNEAFTGVAFIKNYEKFFKELESCRTDTAEIRDTPALFFLRPYVLDRSWIDIGTEEGLILARKTWKGINNLNKLDEELYLVDNHIIKYFYNSNIVKDRMMRVKHMNGTTPEIVASTKNFYKYKFVPGWDLFKLTTSVTMTTEVLDTAQDKLWSQKKELNELQTKLFKDTCRKFYYDKTMARLDKLYEKLGYQDDQCLEHLFKKVNWDFLSDGIAAKFHGDFNFSNILFDGHVNYTFLDWRQNFGDSVEYGDVYYDLAKMYHGFLFPHPMVKENKFYIKQNGDTFIEIPCHIEKCKDVFEKWVVDHGYDLWKIKLLTAIVLLNMSPLHEAPIDEYLYLYAKSYLSEVLHE